MRAGERAHMFWPMAQQYRHLVPWNEDSLPANHRLFDVRALPGRDPRVLWAVLNSTVVALSKHQFGRPTGIEGNLDTEVVDVNMMLVPDPRGADPNVEKRLLDAADAIASRLTARTLVEEFDRTDRQALDDATLELLGVSDATERRTLRSRLYAALREQYTATRDRELVAQRHRARGSRRGPSPAEMADELWQELEPSLGLLEFPRDFLGHVESMRHVDLPPGPVELGWGFIDTRRSPRSGTVRVGGPTGEVVEVGGQCQAEFVRAVAECGHYGSIEYPDEVACATAVQEFGRYREDLERRFKEAAAQRTRDTKRKRAIASALLRKALSWRRSPTGEADA